MNFWKPVIWGIVIQLLVLLGLYYLGDARWLSPTVYALILSLGLVLGSYVAARRSPDRPIVAALIVPLPTLLYILIANSGRTSLSSTSLLQLVVIFLGSACIAAILDSWKRNRRNQ